MYMTRIMLKTIPKPNIIHGILSAALPEQRNATTNENLWRIDKLGDEHALIIVSVKNPDNNVIIRKIGAVKVTADDKGSFIGDIRNKTLDYKEFLGHLEQGQTWNFRLCANPVEHKKQEPSGKRGKVYALRSVTEQINWLDRQSTKSGFILRGCSVIGDEWKVFNTVRIRAITFDGLLTVTDAETFRTALIRGIGRGKAYGCGLLTLARAQT